MSRIDEFRTWLEQSNFTQNSIRARVRAVRVVERNLKAMGLPYNDLEAAWKAKGGYQKVRKRLQEIRKGAKQGGNEFKILMKESENPLNTLRNWNTWVGHYGQFVNGEPRQRQDIDRIREFVLRKYIEPARKNQRREVEVRVRDVNDRMKLHEAWPNICRALEKNVFKAMSKYSSLDQIGKQQSSAKIFRFQLAQSKSKEHSSQPPFSREELIMLLDFYFTNYKPTKSNLSGIPRRSTRELKQLSDRLRKLAIIHGDSISGKFRNLNGIYISLARFNRINPQHIHEERISPPTRPMKEIFSEFLNDKDELHRLARAIIKNIDDDVLVDADLVSEETYEASEGRLLRRTHYTRERDPKIVKRKKDVVMKKKGQLACEACGLVFEKYYGVIGEGFIECHHKKKVSDMKPKETTKMEDLSLICSNCHRMIHKPKVMLTINEIKQLINKARQ